MLNGAAQHNQKIHSDLIQNNVSSELNNVSLFKPSIFAVNIGKIPEHKEHIVAGIWSLKQKTIPPNTMGRYER